ncbi:coq1 putative hexaprenyl diphosphate synthase [Nowakowskiella sp. JEL0078]|nr:coq1 putative hexaprenyl diphosphate synthase [Nowakowskiella sp. JEL0078]
MCLRNYSSTKKNSSSILSQFLGLYSTTPPIVTPTNWPKAVSTAESLVHPQGGSIINPKELVGKDLTLLTDNIRKLLGSGHPVLETISNYYFSKQGKHIRPLIVLLMSQATSTAPKFLLESQQSPQNLKQREIDTPLDVSTEVKFAPTEGPDAAGILPAQRRLAEITEMIHTASLLHDDVIDDSATRRNQPSANTHFGNKMAILAGDFLLARASVALARLRNVEVLELLATVISNLVEGEFMQLRNTPLHEMVTIDKVLASVVTSREQGSRIEYYMKKNYMKTASLIAKSCRAAAVLGRCTEEVSEIAYLYGRNLGLAFQLVDDLLDFVVSADEFGKPVNADLSLGLATAPVLFAAEKFPDLWKLIDRKFDRKGDTIRAKECVFKSDGLERTKSLAQLYCQEAVKAVSRLPPSAAQDALINLTQAVLTRKK